MPLDAVNIVIPHAFEELFVRARYKVYYGGRGSAKSQSIGRALIMLAYTEKHLILCAREYQSSIADSVHRMLVTLIEEMGLVNWFDVQKTTIKSKTTGSEFIFKGLRHNVQEIKSTEGITICWVEEAQSVSSDSWLILDPTIRREGSEIWVSFNPDQEEDPTYQHFVVKPPPDAIVRKVSYRDNDFFPMVLEKQRVHMMETDPDAYDWVWEGNCRRISEATIFRHKVVVEEFAGPEPNERLYFGMDFGFADDPTAIVRCWMHGDDLMIDYEAFGHGIEIDQIPKLYQSIPEAMKWPVRADNSRPETISFLKRQQLNISAADKWSGSIEDGIAHLKAFRRIVIHPRCKNMIQEAKLYSYKVDRQTQDVLPIIVDRHNHGWDAVRYALDGFIRKRGGTGVWEKLANKVR